MIKTFNKLEIEGNYLSNKSPEINPLSYGQLTYDKGGRNIQWRKDSFFNKWCWENWTATCKRMKLEQSLIQNNKLEMA